MEVLYNTEAYVIRSIPYGETHAIVTLLTPSGTVAAMARGAKKPQSRLAGGVQLCVKAMYTLYQGRGMGTISQLEVVDSYRHIREQLELSAYGAYFCELVAAVSDERPGGSEAVYRLFGGALDRLRVGQPSAQIVARIWEVKVLRYLGASPRWDECIRCKKPLDGHAPVHYSAMDGGFVCETCRSGVAQTVANTGRHQSTLLPVPAAVPRVLQQFAEIPFERIGEVRLSVATEASIRKVLWFQMVDYGGLNLKSREFVDSIDELLS